MVPANAIPECREIRPISDLKVTFSDGGGEPVFRVSSEIKCVPFGPGGFCVRESQSLSDAAIRHEGTTSRARPKIRYARSFSFPFLRNLSRITPAIISW